MYWLGSCSPAIFNIFLGMVVQWEVTFKALNNWVFTVGNDTQCDLQEDPLTHVGEATPNILQMMKLRHWQVNNLPEVTRPTKGRARRGNPHSLPYFSICAVEANSHTLYPSTLMFPHHSGSVQPRLKEAQLFLGKPNQKWIHRAVTCLNLCRMKWWTEQKNK